MSRVVTVAPNPSLDESARVERLMPARKLPCSAPLRQPGGGGINVARALRMLGGHPLAVWPEAGPTGRHIARLLGQEGVPSRRVTVPGEARRNMTVYEEATRLQYRFVMPGPRMRRTDEANLLSEVRRACHSASLVVLSGSLPPGCAEDFYVKARAVSRDARILLDTRGRPLRAAVGAGFFLAKPNLDELAQLTSVPLRSLAAIEGACRKLVRRGFAHNIVVSLGAQGAFLVSEREALRIAAPVVPVASRVGAGDSMMAGIALRLSQGHEVADAVRFGVAAGTAAVLRPGSSLCRRSDTLRLFRQLQA